MLRAPSSRGRCSEGAAVVPAADGGRSGASAVAAPGTEAAVAGAPVPAAASVADAPAEAEANRCQARTWGQGKLPQCKNPKKVGDLCSMHASSLPHGRVGEALSANVAKKVKREDQTAPPPTNAIGAGSSSSTEAAPGLDVTSAASQSQAPMSNAATCSWLQPQSCSGRARAKSLLKRSPNIQASRTQIQSQQVGVILRAALEQFGQLNGGDLGAMRLAIMASVRTGEREARLRVQEDKDLQQAKRDSLTLDKRVAEEVAAHRTLIDERLASVRKVAVKTDEDGNCQFKAVLNTLGIATSALTHEELRTAVCDYMEGDPLFWQEFMLGQTFEEYIAKMRIPGKTWGDDLTLNAIAHILNVPIRVVTTTSSHQWSRLIPPLLPSNSEKEEIFIALHGERHYEATGPHQ